MNDGWIILHRKIYNSTDFNNQLEVAVFLYLVSMSSHKPVNVIYRKKKLTVNHTIHTQVEMTGKYHQRLEVN
jgi:hypothetical protein